MTGRRLHDSDCRLRIDNSNADIAIPFIDMIRVHVSVAIFININRNRLTSAAVCDDDLRAWLGFTGELFAIVYADYSRFGRRFIVIFISEAATIACPVSNGNDERAIGL